MDIYKQKFTKLQSEIFRLLCVKVGSRLTQRKIAQILGASPTAVGNSLALLKKENLIKISEESNLHLVELNRDNEKSIGLKRVENLKMIYESGLSSFLEKAHPGCTVLLFGSYSQGNDTVKSDIDIAVIGSRDKNLEMSKFNTLLGRTININYYKELGSIDVYLKANLLSGIILAGAIEL